MRFRVSEFFILRSALKSGAKGGTRTPTAFGHWILSPARLPIPPLSPAVRVSQNVGAPTRTRTWNQQIKSLLLYQLSYGGAGNLLTRLSGHRFQQHPLRPPDVIASGNEGNQQRQAEHQLREPHQAGSKCVDSDHCSERHSLKYGRRLA